MTHAPNCRSCVPTAAIPIGVEAGDDRYRIVGLGVWQPPCVSLDRPRVEMLQQASESGAENPVVVGFPA